jgi:pseudaminic acid synthase
MRFKIGDADLVKHKKVFVVAEISANHGQDFNRAVTLIKKAKECGADAVKFQTYTPGTLTIDVDNKYFRIKHSKWAGQTLYQLYKKAYTPWAWFEKLKKAADDLDICFFSTAFDKTSIDFLEELGIPVHKIASFELTDLPLIEYAARTKKPIIISTGMGTAQEIREAVATARKTGNNKILLLKCVSSYPAAPEGMNLRTIPDMAGLFKLPVGLSDHTLDMAVPVSAVSLGAVFIEKHFTLSRAIKTPDSFFSTEPEEFREIVKNIRTVEKALGRVQYGSIKDDFKNRIYRRSLFVVDNIKKGERFSESNIRSIRPAYGLAPKHLKNILRKRSKINIKNGSPLTRKMIDA